jgi:hypothetical protein
MCRLHSRRGSPWGNRESRSRSPPKAAGRSRGATCSVGRANEATRKRGLAWSVAEKGWQSNVSRVSPPASEGTEINGITGTQEPIQAHAGLRVDRRRSADAWALASSIALVAEAQALRPELRAAVLLTRLTSSTALSRGARGVVEGAGLPVLRAALGYRVAFAESLAAGQGVTTYAPGDLARLEVEHLADELDAFGTDEESSRHVA